MHHYYKKVEKSQTLLLNEQSRLLEQSGNDVYKFGFGQSPFPPLPAAIARFKDSAATKDYAPVQGISELRANVAAFHREAEGIDITDDRVLIAPGSKILIYAVMAAFEQADVLIPAPSWVSYVPQARLLGHNPIKVITTYDAKWRVTPESIEQAVKNKPNADIPSILIFNYPGNPDGLSYDTNELKALAETFKRHKILVISDEIYGLLNHTGAHQSLAKFYPEATIVTGGLSKWCGAGGWRLGIALLPKTMNDDFKETMLGIASETYSCATLPVQLAACEAYKWNDEAKNYLFHQRRLLSFIGNWSADKLKKAGVQVHSPQGGFYLFLDFTPFADKLRKQGVTTSHELCAKLLKDTGVALLPGDAFSMNPDHLSARLAYVEFNGQAALDASEKIGKNAELDDSLLKGVFLKTANGIEALCNWLK
jgi:aspartate aminotransferase